jgi:hypothetical protein
VCLVAPIFSFANQKVFGFLAVGSQRHQELGVNHRQKDEQRAKITSIQMIGVGSIIQFLLDQSLILRG